MEHYSETITELPICGAKTKSGGQCNSVELLAGNRCRAHGGLSTGPRTVAGKRRSALNTGKTYDELCSNRASRPYPHFTKL